MQCLIYSPDKCHFPGNLLLTDPQGNESDTESSHLDDIREKFGIIEEAISEHKSSWSKLKPRVWKVLNDPSSSVYAKVRYSVRSNH